MRIIQAGKNDIANIIAIGRKTFIETEGDEFRKHQKEHGIETYLKSAFDKDNIVKELTENTVDYLICENEKDAEIIGYAKVKKDVKKKEAELCKIYFLKTCQGNGLGTTLWDVIESGLRQEHFKSVTLWVWTENTTAINFYKKKGFLKAGERKVNIGGWKSNDDLMKKELN